MSDPRFDGSRFLRLVCRFRRDDGNVAILFGLTLPILIGGAAFGVETSYWYYKDLQLQASADAAAYAGAVEKRSGSDTSLVKAAAMTMAAANGFDPSIGTIAVNTPPLDGPNQAKQAVEVILRQPVQRFFTTIFSQTPIIEMARAVADFSTTGNACILALSPTASKSVLFSGNTSVTVKNCNVMANSIADDAIKTQGSSVTKVSCLISAGGVDVTGGTLVTDCEKPRTQASPVGDPFAAVPEPSASGGCKNGKGATLQPGNYCGGLDLKKSVTLNPGTYVVSGGNFKVNANADVTGTGVTIYLAGDARVSMNGNAAVNLSAPTSGTYSGILFFGDRSNSGSTMNKFNGTADSKMTGAIYFAKQPVDYLGNFSGVDGCTQIVADTIQWSGSTTIEQDCSKHGMDDIASTQLVNLAE